LAAAKGTHQPVAPVTLQQGLAATDVIGSMPATAQLIFNNSENIYSNLSPDQLAQLRLILRSALADVPAHMPCVAHMARALAKFSPACAAGLSEDKKLLMRRLAFCLVALLPLRLEFRGPHRMLLLDWYLEEMEKLVRKKYVYLGQHGQYTRIEGFFLPGKLRVGRGGKSTVGQGSVMEQVHHHHSFPCRAPSHLAGPPPNS
jgi:hypothetical protein